MHCPACGEKHTSIIETRCFDGTSVDRRRACACGFRWSTREKYIRGTGATVTTRTTTISRPSVAHLNDTGSTPADKPSPLHPPPDPFPSPDILSHPDQSPDQTRVEGKSKKTRPAKLLEPPKYSAEFEALWAGVRSGDKASAAKAYRQVGSPDPALCVASWQRYEDVAWPDGIGKPYLATWLRRFAWLRDPEPPPGAKKKPGAPKPPAASMAAWCLHHRELYAGRPAKLKPGCPECDKEALALGASAEPLPEWAE